jgi:chemotaxis regulatin CheY-phosphate phosphatase CheZ
MSPPAAPSQEAQEHIDKQRHPDLPRHGVGALAKEVGELKRCLRDFMSHLEKDSDLPTAAVKIRDAWPSPCRKPRVG